jgi:hypothetical protein
VSSIRGSTPGTNGIPPQGSPVLTPTLSPEHLRTLTEGSGIDLGIIAERGYGTCLDLDTLLQYWIRPIVGVTFPGILMPLHSTAGGPATYHHPDTGNVLPYAVYRPDTVLVGADGHSRKYLNAPSTELRLDCHPRVHAVVRDPSVPIWICEGLKNAMRSSRMAPMP